MPATTPPPDNLLAYFFRSAIACYNAKPWKLLGAADKVRILVHEEPPYFAFATGGDAAGTPGLMLTPAFPHDDEAAVAQGLIAFGGGRLSLTFGAEGDAPEWLREVRRAKKWPLASPVAFPSFSATDANGDSRELADGELRVLAVAMSVMAAFIGSRRKQIESRQPFGDVFKVRDEAGVEQVAMLQYPFDEDDLSGWRSYKYSEIATAPANRAFHEVWNAALDLPYAPRVLDRLVWSFFQDVAPDYLVIADATDDDADDEVLEGEAYLRFVSWALFGYRTERGTLAEQAVEVMAATRSDEELALHRRLLLPRAGVFVVTDVQRKVGLHLRDTLAVDASPDETIEVVDRTASRQLDVGFGVLGMLHPMSDTQWMLSPGVAFYPSLPELDPSGGDYTAESFGPTLEVMAFGAGTEWIQALTGENLHDAYEAFAATLADCGDVLPPYEQFQQEIATAEQPSDVVTRLQDAIVWWSDAELGVMLAFIMRVWNVTPRAELGGKSPEEMYVSGERVRARRPAGRGRRR